MRFRSCAAAGLLLFGSNSAADEATPVSFHKEIVPVLKRSCQGCHHPGKLKGELDVTTHAALSKGGKHGPVIAIGDPKQSLIIKEISGTEPSMPAEGDPLSAAEVALFERWIAQGAKDDTPAELLNRYKLAAPPVYPAPAVISAAVYSPDGALIAVSGYHEVLLHNSDGSGLAGRLLGESPRVESIAFSSDGKLLAVAGGAPAVFGEVQIWKVTERELMAAYKVSIDSLYGVSFSPDNQRVAFGAADKSVRILNIVDGKELMKFDNHSDWVFATTFTLDGTRVLSGSRDRAMKLINVSNGQFIDDINKLLEPVLCMSRHPKQDVIAYGGELGTPRVYRISENQGRTAANNDVNLQKAFERQPGPVHSIAYSPDGEQIAIGSVDGEVRIYKADGTRAATLKGHSGAVFAISWHPNKPEIVTGGYDGKLRVFNPANGELLREFIPFPMEEGKQVAALPGS